MKPDVVICSAGRNNIYGHPDPEILERIRSIGASPVVTSESGDMFIPTLDDP